MVQRFNDIPRYVQVVQRFNRYAPFKAFIWRTAVQGSMFNGNVESIKSELGSNALEHIDGAYALRERSEAYAHDFGAKVSR